jgi:kynurenine 3-monooxygenase
MEKQNMSNKHTSKIAIVGCGPAGLVAAIALARRGIHTTIFEKAQNPNIAPRYNPDRSYAIDITGHGLKALKYIEATDTFDEQMIPFKGIKLQFADTEEAYENKGWTGSRGDILRTMMHLVDEQYSEWIHFEFESMVEAVDVYTGEVSTLSQDGSDVQQIWQFDLIIGADGGGSKVREAMQMQIPNFKTTYKEIPNYATMIELDRNLDDLDKRYLYILATEPFCVAGAIQGATANTVRWFCVVGTNHEVDYDNIDEVRQMFQDNAPVMLDYVSEDSLKSFAGRECYHIGRMLSCSQLYGGKAVLLGDAGAPFSPIGQGINAAMESAMVLDMCIDGDRPEQLYQGAKCYNDQWKPEADAITWISERFVFNSKPQLIRQVLTAKFGANVMTNAKDPHLSYSAVRHQAERLKLVWGW